MAERSNQSPVLGPAASRSQTAGQLSVVLAMPVPTRPISMLFADGNENGTGAEPQDRSCASDLNLDQIVAAISRVQEEKDFIAGLLYQRVDDIDTVHYRHEVFRDLEDASLLASIREFADVARTVRTHLKQAGEMRYQYQREGWFLDAVAGYCDVVRTLAGAFTTARVTSRALVAFRAFLTEYVASPAFVALAADTKGCKEALAQVRYCTRIRGARVDVTRYEGQPDYSVEVLETFDRFKQGAVKDYRINYRLAPGMNHVAAQIVDLVARLFPEEFQALDEYCRVHAGFFDATVRRFEREIHFYLAYLDYIGPLRDAGLSFCYPELTATSKAISATDTFDLALAKKLVAEHRPIVSNDFHMGGPERIFVVSGPNQGGKTTFARTFGQLHHLAGIGCLVPGSAARLFFFDNLFAHFERSEDITNLRGKLEDDLLRIRQILHAATPNSIVIMNEIFTSTTLSDARFLGEKVLRQLIHLDVLCVYVTFVDELASLGESVVSMISTIVPENPAERTYKVIRGPADGLAYALAIAEKHNLTYDRLRRRIVA
jgi:DNA mismatch repair protein MutS